MSDHYLKQELYKLVQTDPGIFDFIQDGSLDGIWYWDLEKPEVEWMSPRFWETFGYDPSSKMHLAAEWKDLIHPDDLKLVLENFEKHCADSNHKYDQYVRYKHQKGHWVWIRCRGLVIRGQDGKPSRMLGAHTDVTEIFKVEENKELISQLKRTNEELEIFAFAASHDLQSPIRSLRGLFALLKSEYDETKEDQISDILEKIESKLLHAQNLMDSVLTFSGLKKLDLKNVNIDDLLSDVCKEVSSIYRDEVEFVTDIFGNAKVDPIIFRRAISNLIINSVKFKKPNDIARIEIRNETSSEKFRIRIADNGIGIDKSWHEKIFTPFSRIHKKDAQSGSGLGLAIVKRAMDLHKGIVSIKSEPDAGTEISLEIPIRA